jgi:hypothetical protein
MISKTSLVAFLIFLFISCGKDSTSYDYKIKYEGDKIVINGYITPQKGCVINISKSIPAIGTFPVSSLEVNNARIFLFENGKNILELKSIGKGNFISENFTPSVGNRYAIKATADNLATVQSSEVIVPDTPQVKKINMLLRKGTNTDDIADFEISLNNLKGIEVKYYTIICTSYNEKDYLAQYFSNLDINNISCDFNSNFDAKIQYFSNKCISNGIFQTNYAVVYGHDSRIKQLDLTLSSISKAYFDYLQSQQQPIGKEKAFLEPTAIYTNINNGYGVFYAQNSVKYQFKL